MQGNKKLIVTLNQLLADELSAISQYMVHSEMCANWGYQKLHKAIEHQAHEEMHHAHWLIQRIIFLDGVPIVSKLSPIHIGKTVAEMVSQEKEAESAAVDAYNAAITQSREAGDQTTLELLSKILVMEEKHLDWGRQQRTQIEQIGLELYLAQQTVGVAD